MAVRNEFIYKPLAFTFTIFPALVIKGRTQRAQVVAIFAYDSVQPRLYCTRDNNG